MFDVYDSECLVHIYRFLQKKCDVLDNCIKNHAFTFSPNYDEFGAEDIYTSIIELMARKNQLINLKLILDDVFSELDNKDRQIISCKINYSLSMEELCGILGISMRGAFRRLERALNNLTEQLNCSKYAEKLVNIMQSEIWIQDYKQNIKLKRLSYKQPKVNSL